MTYIIIPELSASDSETFASLFIEGFGYENRTEFIHKSKELDGRKDATALTTRNDISWQSPEFQKLSFFTKWHSMEKLLDHYQDTPYPDAKYYKEYSSIAGADGQRFQELYLNYKFSPKGQLRLGRQAINDGSFIRDFNWVQNPESYRALSLAYEFPKHTKLYFAHTDKIYDRWMKSANFNGINILTLKHQYADNNELTFRCINIHDGQQKESKHNRGDKTTHSLELDQDKLHLLYAYQKATQDEFPLHYLESRLKLYEDDARECGLGYRYRQERSGHLFDLLGIPSGGLAGWTESYDLLGAYHLNKLSLKARLSLLKSPMNSVEIGAKQASFKLDYQSYSQLKAKIATNYLMIHGDQESRKKSQGDQFLVRAAIVFTLWKFLT